MSWSIGLFLIEQEMKKNWQIKGFFCVITVLHAGEL